MSMLKIAWILTVGMFILKVIGVLSVSWWAVIAPIPVVACIALLLGSLAAVVVMATGKK